MLTEDNKLRYLPLIRRTLEEAHPHLLEAFRGLASGVLPWPLFLTGEVATGKTRGALALLDHLSSGYYTTTFDLIGLRMASFKHNAPEMPWESLLAVKYRKLVVLDEVGVGRAVSETHFECVKKVLDMREDFPLVVISNESLASIATLYDDRTASRCGAGTTVELKGRDRRTG